MAATLNTADLRHQFRCADRLSSSPSIVAADARCAVFVVCEDVIINGVLDARIPLVFSTWRNRTGLSELPPLFASRHRREWIERVRIDRSALRFYSCAVALATDAYLARQTDQLTGELTARVLNALLQTLAK